MKVKESDYSKNGKVQRGFGFVYNRFVGAWFGTEHMQHSGLVRSESWEVVLRLNNAEGVFSKGNDCGFFFNVFVCFYVCTETLAYM